MNTLTKPLLALTLALGLTGQALAECQGGENLAILAATPSAEFFDFGNGTVLHRSTQLVWMRCAIGQSWTGSACSGTADSLDWGEALLLADGFEFVGATDWRLPNRNELASIVESRCHGPAINGAIFPASPAAGFWTSSPAQAEPESAWQVEFDQGALLTGPSTGTAALRLVRGGRM